MKNSKLVKIVLVVIMSLAVIIATKSSFAVTSLDPNSLTGISNTENTENKETANNVLSNSELNSNTILNKTTNNVVLTTNNTSAYNNSSLPKTGVGDSMPIVVLAVALGISAIYAYKKIQDYKNIQFVNIKK